MTDTQAAGDAIPREVVEQLARDVVAQTAPDELPLFRATSEAYFERPAGAADRSRDEMLGFGVGDALVLITPVALSVAQEVLDFLAEELRDRAREAGKDALDRLVDRIFRKRSGQPQPQPQQVEAPVAPPELTDEQLRHVRELAIQKAEQLKLPADQAQLLADSLVGSLAIE